MPRTPRPLSAKQLIRRAQYLEFIRAFEKRQGIPPALRDFVRSKKLGVKSVSTVNYYLDVLRDEGLIKRTPRISRGIRITPKGAALLA
jgi:SOS-response transcriptional repressor LexA